VLDHPGVNIAGLQEWGNNRNDILRATGSLRRFPPLSRWRTKREPAPHSDKWTWARPLIGGGPVGARVDHLQLRTCRAVLLSGPTLVETSGRHPRGLKPANFATLGVFTDPVTGQTVDVISYHFVSSRNLGPKRAALGVKQERALRKLVTQRRVLGHLVYALGDSNNPDFTIPGMLSAWTGYPDTGGSHGTRRIDDVFGEVKPVTELVTTLSDHKAVIATRNRKA
jgi:hypothetical protein